MKILKFIILVLILTLAQNIVGQITKKVVGSEEYINGINRNADKIGLDDLQLSKDSLRIRIWSWGNLIDLTMDGDSIYVQKIIYIFTNPSYKRNPQKGTIKFKKTDITKEQNQLIKENIRLICQHNPLGKNTEIYRDSFYMNNSTKINFDSISNQTSVPKPGGIENFIEFANQQEYLVAAWISCSQMGEVIERLITDLNMKKDQKVFCDKLPHGAWYSYGGTCAWYKASCLESIYLKLIQKR